MYFAGGSSPLAAAVDSNSLVPHTQCSCGQEVKRQMEEVTTGIQYCLARFVSVFMRQYVSITKGDTFSEENLSVLEIENVRNR